MKLLAPAFAILAVGFAAAPALAGDVTFTFDTAASTGKVLGVLFNSEAAYGGSGGPVRQFEVDVAAGQHVAVLHDLPDGDYGLKVFHDVNGNGKMDVNPFGLPIEPYAFSNNAIGNMGPAGWDRARFTVAGDTAQTIKLK